MSSEVSWATANLLFVTVADPTFAPGGVYIYATATGKQVGLVTDKGESVAKVAVGPSNELYVSNPTEDTVSVYKIGQTSVLRYYFLLDPQDLVVGRDGTLYVIGATNKSSHPSVLVYPKGATSPSAAIVDPNLAGGPFSVTLDNRNHLYVGGFVTESSRRN